MTHNSDEELRRFAETLVRNVRDSAIVSCDRLARGELLGPTAQRWRSILDSEDAKKAVFELVPDIVDQTLFELLNSIDNCEISLAWKTHNGTLVDFDEIGLGEMSGWLMGSPGWRHDFSAERFFDDLKDLKLELNGGPEA